MTDAKFPEGRKLLALYPVLLFYLSLAWIVLVGFQQGSQHSAVAEGVSSAPAPDKTEASDNPSGAEGTERIVQALRWLLNE